MKKNRKSKNKKSTKNDTKKKIITNPVTEDSLSQNSISSESQSGKEDSKIKEADVKNIKKNYKGKKYKKKAPSLKFTQIHSFQYNSEDDFIQIRKKYPVNMIYLRLLNKFALVFGSHLIVYNGLAPYDKEYIIDLDLSSTDWIPFGEDAQGKLWVGDKNVILIYNPDNCELESQIYTDKYKSPYYYDYNFIVNIEGMPNKMMVTGTDLSITVYNEYYEKIAKITTDINNKVHSFLPISDDSIACVFESSTLILKKYVISTQIFETGKYLNSPGQRKYMEKRMFKGTDAFFYVATTKSKGYVVKIDIEDFQILSYVSVDYNPLPDTYDLSPFVFQGNFLMFNGKKLLNFSETLETYKENDIGITEIDFNQFVYLEDSNLFVISNDEINYKIFLVEEENEDEEP